MSVLCCVVLRVVISCVVLDVDGEIKSLCSFVRSSSKRIIGRKAIFPPTLSTLTCELRTGTCIEVVNEKINYAASVSVMSVTLVAPPYFVEKSSCDLFIV